MSKYTASTTNPPYGSVDINTCSINKYSGHEYQFVAINGINGYRNYVGVPPATFDCVGTVRSDPIALYLYANGDANAKFEPDKKCYRGVSQNLFIDSIKVRKQRKENTDGNLIYKIIDELIESKGDSHLVSRRKLLDYRLKDFVTSAVGGKNPDDYVYYVFVTTSRISMENDGFISYPPPGYANIDYIKGAMSFHHYKISENVKMSVKNRAGESVSFTMSLDPLNDTYVNPGISFNFELKLYEKYTINVQWTNKGEKFNYTYGFFVINSNTKINELNIEKCEITNPPYNPVEAAGTSLFNCRTLSYSPLYKRSLSDLLNRYVSVYGSTKTNPTKVSQSEKCDLNHITESDKQNRGLDVFNFYRYYIGAPDIKYNDEHQSSCDKSGIFSLVNNIMDHTPTSGECYSEEAVKCLSESNLARGYESIEEAYTGWMIDTDSKSVGHRRFMMNPYLNATTISALQIGSNSFYVQRIMDNNYDDVQGVSPFYAYPPPGFVIREISPKLRDWNSFHHDKIKDDNLKVKVVDVLGGEVNIRTSKAGLTSDQPLPCILWQFSNEPMIGKQYTITVSWKNLGADFVFNYTMIYVNLDTKVTIREPTQCSVESNSALFDCEVVSNHSGYLYDYETLKNSYNDIMKRLPSNLEDVLTKPVYNNGWKVPAADVYRKGSVISYVMFDLLNLIRKWIGSSEVGDGSIESMSKWSNMSDICYAILYYGYPKHVPDQTMCKENCLVRYNTEIGSNECYKTGIFSSGSSVMESFYNLISTSGWAMENRRTFFDYSLLKATFVSMIYPQPNGKTEYETIGNFRNRDRSKLSDNFIAYPAPGIALKELIHGDFSFHHDGLSTPITLKIWNKAGEEVNYSVNFDGVYQYVFKGFSYKIENLKIGERYTVEVTWDGGGINYDYKYIYYYVDINTSPQLTAGCKYDPDYKPTSAPTFPPRTDAPKPTIEGRKIALFSYDSKSYTFKKSDENIIIEPDEKYDDTKFSVTCDNNKEMVSVAEAGTITVKTGTVDSSTCTITCNGDNYESYSSIIKFEVKEKIIPTFDTVNSVFPSLITPNEPFNVISRLNIPNDFSLDFPIEMNLTISHSDFKSISIVDIVDGLYEVRFENIKLEPVVSKKRDVYVEIRIGGKDSENNYLERFRKSVAVIYKNDENGCENPDQDGLCCERNVELGESCKSLTTTIPFTSSTDKFVKDFNKTFYETIIEGNPFRYTLRSEAKKMTFDVKYYSNLAESKTMRLLADYPINWEKVKNPLAFVEVLVDKIQDDSIVIESSFIEDVLGVKDSNTIAYMNQKLADQSDILKNRVVEVLIANNVNIDPNAEIIKENKFSGIEISDEGNLPDDSTNDGGDNDDGGVDNNDGNNNNKSWAKDNWWVILIICIAVVLILSITGIVVYAKSSKKDSNKNPSNKVVPETKIEIEEEKKAAE